MRARSRDLLMRRSSVIAGVVLSCIVAAAPVIAQPIEGDAGLTASSTTAGAAPFDLARLARQVRPSVVQLVAMDALGEKIGTGTGFFITTSGVIATNHHVIDRAEQMVALLSDGSQRTITGIISVDEEDDVALVQAEGEGFSALPLGTLEQVESGTPIVVVGNPLGMTWSLSEGIVSAIRMDKGAGDHPMSRHEHPGGLIQFNAPVTFGSSGSPILMRDGRVIGVAQSVLAVPGATMNFAVPVTELRTLLDQAGETPTAQPFREVPVRNLLISLGVFLVAAVVLWRSRRARG